MAYRSIDRVQTDFNKGLYRLSLTKQINTILQQYPDDNQILKELIQNSEDARANTVKFLLDRCNTYETESLIRENLEEYQGPALLAYNDALIEEEDWKGLRLMYESVKEFDALKVGRFGLGFKSVFHMTDLPSVISGMKISFIDPHETYFHQKGKKGSKTSSYMIDIERNRQEIASCPDQWKPYKHSVLGTLDQGFESRRPYPGTLFRFPLRSSADSEISSTIYTESKVLNLFKSLKGEGYLYFLFFKFIESIQIYCTNANGDPELEFEICLSSSCLQEVRHQRKLFVECLQSNRDCDVNYTLEIEEKRYSRSKLLSKEVHKFIVCQMLQYDGEESELRSLSEKLKVLPVVGLAYPLQNERIDSQTFCFLPLPIEEKNSTGLPLHVNGYFSVDNNRRHLKIASMDGNDSDSVRWNTLLIDSLLAKALKSLILNCTLRNGFKPETVFGMVPDPQLVKSIWHSFVKNFYCDLTRMKIIGVVGSSRKIIWKDLSNVIVKPIGWSKGITSVVKKILEADGKSFAEIPPFILTGLRKYRLLFQEADVITVSKSFRNVQNIRRIIYFINKERLILLEFILSTGSHHSNLIGLELLPLANGKWTSFSGPSFQNVYIEKDSHTKDLLPVNLSEKFLERSLPLEIMKQLKKLASTGVTQLCHFDKSKFLQEAKAVFKTPLFSIPEKNYFQNLWFYIYHNFSTSLDPLRGFYIVPHKNGKTINRIPQHEESAIINIRAYLSSKERELLTVLNVEIYEAVPQYVLNHPQIYSLFYSDSNEDKAKAILNQLKRMTKPMIVIKIQNLSSDAKLELRKIFYSLCPNISREYKNLVHTLSIFQTLAGDFVSLTECCKAGHNYNYILSIPESIIDMDAEYTVELLKINPQMKLLTVPDILLLILNEFHSYNYTNGSERFIKYCLLYMGENLPLQNKLSETEFIRLYSGDLVRPQDILDPRDAVIKSLFDGEDVFPNEEFTDKQSLQNLSILGMRRINCLREREVIGVATSIDREKNYQKGLILLKHFNKNASLWLKVSVRVCELSWIPILHERPANYPNDLEWRGCHDVTGRLRDMRSFDAVNICGSSCFIPAKSTDIVSTWPSLEEVVDHLSCCIESYDHSERAAYMSIITEIYAYLAHNFISEDICDCLQNNDLQEWVWVGGRFASPVSCSFTSAFTNFEPYLFVIPPEMKKFQDFLINCGVGEEFLYVDILRRIQEYHQNYDDEFALGRDVNYSVSIINHIADTDCDTEDLILPIQGDSLDFASRDTCCYWDSSADNKGIGLEDLDDNLFLIHKHISPHVAEKLGVPSLLSVFMTDEDFGFDTGYGQSECLTTRLKNILRDYKDGLAIIKELIQNADDAGASTVKIVYDDRKFKSHKSSLFDESMYSLQGPAFLAYNDAVFSEEDLQNIIKLGGATKENITQKVGRFGLGFNSVYHLTEVPSFISGNSVVFFDPHKKYLGKAMRNKDQPGIKLDMTRRFFKKQREIFTDQFYPFNGLFDCDLSPNSSMENYPGTLFRFPLRTAIQAESSEISNKTYSEGEIKELFRLLYGNRETMLMFLQNVCRLEVYHLSEREETPELDLIFSIEKEIIEKIDSSIDNTEKFNILKSTKQIVEQKSNRQLNRRTFIQRILSDTGLGFDQLNLEEFRDDKQVKIFLISSHTGLKQSLLFARQSQKYLPIGGVALELNEDHSLKECEAFEGQLFCFLPLPIKICLPFHINGYFAVSSSRTEICSDNSHDKNDEKSNWNKSVMIDSVLQAFIRCLEVLKEKHDLSISSEQWYSLWPVKQEDLHSLRNHIDSFRMSFYSSVVRNEDMKVFMSDDKWIDYSDCVFLDASFRESPIGNLSLRIFKKVISMTVPNKTVIDIPESICRCLRLIDKENFNDHFYERIRFFREIVIRNVELIDKEDYSELILHTLYHLEDSDESIFNLLKYSSCIPSSGLQKIFLKPNQLIDPTSKLQCLYKIEDHRFPKWRGNHMNTILRKYLSNKKCADIVFSKLRDLGMEANTLPWKELIDRSKTVQKCIKDMGLKRSVLIVDLIAEKIQKKKPSKEIIPELFDIPFLPTLQSGPEMKLPRKYSNKPWCSINEGYLSECQSLVSCSFPIIDSFEMAHQSKHGWRPFAQYFGLNDKSKNISNDVVDHQLSTVVQEVKSVNTKKNKIMKSFKKMIEEILSYHENHLRETDQVNSKLNFKILSLFFCVERNCFIELSKCSQKSDSIPPYLYKLSFQFINNFQCLLTHLGIPEEFSDFDYISVLNTIQEQSCGKTISSRDMQVCLSVIKRLHEYIGHHKRNIKELPPIYVPDSNNKMRLASDLCFNNTPWIKSVDKNFIHQDIPYTYAESLGIKDIRYKILDDCRIGLPFGQKENLTRRIKTLLKGYKFDTTILKEILQNSDDCGANVLYFILDSRQHKTERIFFPEWSNLQGPALLVYNDKTFTQEDIEGIQNLGEGSKRKKPLKTGQFGVGFNCVYHLTDTPTFITDVPDLGECLFTFDPQCKYVHGADKNCPGQRYPTERVEKDFPDVFECYRSVQEMIGSRHGTLFRLPLRSKEMLENNELVDHDEEVSPKVIRNLLKKMSSELNKCLLFMKSIVTIKLCEIDSQSDHLKDIMWSSSIIPDEDVDNRQRYNSHINETCEKLKVLSDIPTVQAEENVCEKRIIYRNYDCPNSRELEEKWLVVDRFGANNRDDMCKELLGVKEPLESLPRGGVAVLLSGRPRGYQEKHNFFCLLPLPFKCNLPVHVNGHFSLEYETRRHFTNDGIGQLWNSFLIKSVIAPAYLTLVLKLKDYEGGMKSLESFKDWYYGKFPTLRSESSQNDDWVHKQLVESFYHLLGESKSAYFPMITQGNGEPRLSWHELNERISKIYFDTLEDQFANRTEYVGIFSVNPNRGKAVELSNLLKKFGMILIKCPFSIRNSIRECKIEINSVDPQRIVEYFSFQFDSSSLVGKHVSETLFKTVNLFEYFFEFVVGGLDSSSNLRNEELQNTQASLNDLPFVLSCDELIHSLDRNQPLFYFYQKSIIPTRDDIFLHSKLYCYGVLKPFVKGMTIDDLSKHLPDILSIEDFTSKEIAMTSLPECLDNFWLSTLWNFLQENLNLNGRRDQNYLSLGPINRWSLTPVIRRGEKLLIPIEQLRGVLDLSQSLSIHLSSALRKLSIYEPNFEAFQYPYSRNEDSDSILPHLIGSVQNAKDILYALSLVAEHKFNSAILEIVEAEELCRTFSSCSDQDLRSANVLLIKSIPMFIDICGNIDSIDPRAKIFTLPPDFSTTDELDVLSRCSNPSVKFLRRGDCYENLYKYIKCQSIKIDDAYLNIILPKYNTFSPDSLLKHVEFLRDLFCNKDKWEKLPRSKELIRTLRNVKFIQSTVTHQLHSPSHFYNPYVKIFRLMVEPDRLLPKQFDHQWMNFLIELGMVNDLSNEDFLKFAQEIASHPDSKYSSELVNCLFNDTERDESFIQKIKSILFVEPYKIDKKYTSIAPQYGQRNINLPYISFDKATLQSNSVLVWTQAKLLKDRLCYNKYTDLLNQLGVQEKPDPETVCNHLIFICDKLKDMNDTMWCLEQILIPIYNYLKEFKLNENIVDKLEHSDIIPIKRDGKNHLFFVQPSYVVVKNLLEDDEIFPYLCKLPNYLGPFEEFIQSLGAHEGLNCGLYAAVLEIICDNSGGNLLEPNERKFVIKGTQKFFELLNKSDETYGGEELYLPTEDGRLESSNKLVYIDDPALKKRVTSLSEPILCTEDIQNYDLVELFKKLPVHLRPQLLSSVVVEEISSVEYSSIKERFFSKLSSKLCSDLFLRGLTRIVSAHKSEVNFDDISAVLKKIHLKSVSRLTTILKYKDEEIPDSNCEKSFHVDCQSVLTIIYLKSDLNGGLDETLIKDKLQTVIKQLLHLNAEHARFIGIILDVNDAEIEEALDKLSVKEYKSKKSFQFSCGEYVHLDLHDLLVQGLDFKMCEGDYVAYQLHDPESEDDPVFIIAQIVEIIVNEENKLLNKSRINIGDGEIIEIDMIFLFRFDRSVFTTPILSQEQMSSMSTVEMSLVIHERNASDTRNIEYNIEDAKKEITKSLRDANKISPEAFKQVYKRLALQWHPDKNPQDTIRCTEIFQFLQNEAARIQSNIGDLFENIERRANSYSNTFRSRRFDQEFWEDYSNNRSSRPNPQPAEAKRWLRQAKFDLESSQNDNYSFNEWVCFKCHQAAEKALKAVRFHLGISNTRDHNLLYLCWDDDEVKAWCHQLECIGSSSSYRYPDQHCGRIPHDAFQADGSRRAYELASSIIRKASQLVNS